MRSCSEDPWTRGAWLAAGIDVDLGLTSVKNGVLGYELEPLMVRDLWAWPWTSDGPR